MPQSSPDPEPANCPRCGTTLLATDAGQVCARCLMETAMHDTRDEVRSDAGQPIPDPEALDPLFDRYHVVERIGRGSTGAVYRARDQRFERDVALKVLIPSGPPGSTAADEFVERFEREARTLARLDHPNLVGIRDFGRVGEGSDSICFLVLDLVDGTDLRALMSDSLSIEEIDTLAEQIARGLAHAHDHGVVHRDVKPENVLVDGEGHVRLVDFGLAKILDPEARPATRRLTHSGEALGTAFYMAPEQLRGEAIDARADVYGFGVVLYEMLTGQLPVGRFEPPSSHRPEAARFDHLADRTLRQAPAERLEDARRVLEEWPADLGLAPRPPRTPAANILHGGLMRWAWENAALFAVALLVLPSEAHNQSIGAFRWLGIEYRTVYYILLTALALRALHTLVCIPPRQLVRASFLLAIALGIPISIAAWFYDHFIDFSSVANVTVLWTGLASLVVLMDDGPVVWRRFARRRPR